MAFFSKFPKRYYDTRADSVLSVVTDIFRFVDVDDLLNDSGAGAYTYVEIQDGERPDVLSYRLYGSSDFYWTFFILNDSLKEGINHSWPLSSQEFERTCEDEYDRFSVLTFLPAYATDLDGNVSQGNTFSGIILEDEFLPYLRLQTTSVVPGAITRTASIMKWDDTLMQLWIYGASGDMSSTSAFKLGWSNPFEEDSNEWIENETLKATYIARMIDIFSVSDPTGYASFAEALAGETDLTEAAIIKYNYVFGKIYSKSDFWASARNAAAYYFDPLDESNILTAIDADASDNYVSNYEMENALNAEKSKIRVVNKNSIAAFSAAYFSTLRQ